MGALNRFIDRLATSRLSSYLTLVSSWASLGSSSIPLISMVYYVALIQVAVARSARFGHIEF